MAEFPRFPGNCPRNVAKDAKYSIRTDTAAGQRGPVVTLVFRAAEDERWYATTDAHPTLVNMVNSVKMGLGLPPNGAFYINEYKQVIVPTAHSDAYYYAGQYDEPLRFEFEGHVLSGDAVDLAGNLLTPGDIWAGPHPGIPYKLMAGGSDITYTSKPRPRVEKTIRLSRMIGLERASAVAARIRDVKGFAGGRFYVNEFRTIFAPVREGQEWRYVYIGRLDLDNWFPVPEIQPLSVEVEQQGDD